MRPIHEQEWTEFNTHAQVCMVDDGKLHPVARVVPNARVRRFISAAPDMARALMADMVLWDDGLLHDEFRCPILAGGTCAEWCATKRTALRKAGVIPTQLPPASSDNQS